MYPKQATRPEFAKFYRNTATNRRGAGIRNRRNAGTGAERFALLAFAKLENVATKVVADEICSCSLALLQWEVGVVVR